MSTQEPFDPNQDPDATMMVPTPGGRRTAPVPAAPPSQPSPRGPTDANVGGGLVPGVGPSAASEPAAPSLAGVAGLPGCGLNPLVRAANPLLDLVVPLRTTAQPPDLPSLRERLALAIKTFETDARSGGVDTEAIAAARYALCTLLDETIASTAWGSGVWSTRSLLVAFHNEAAGGEKVFLILLGLEGRYRMIDQGQAQLATLRERLLQLIRQHRGGYEADLSPAWRGEGVSAASPLRRIPLWVLIAAAAVLLLIVQLVCGVVLNRKSDPVFAGLSK